MTIERLAQIRQLAEVIERRHECPSRPDRAKWCAAEPCLSAATFTALRELLRELNADE